MKLNKGFTLIEMLVVIAVIGILSAAVLTGLGPARTKAKDARIVSAVQQGRIIVEGMYDGTTQTYPGSITIDPDGSGVLDKTAKEIATNGGGSLTYVGNSTDQSSYALYATLNSGKYYCVDSASVARELDVAPTNPQCQ